uniref:Uncharacterized protein n=1 Tax=Euplotes crassus TaxID=5936 RepID=A0A7S3NQ90_EUPCR|mmetsp:Transcript_2077/g.1960  ORF Transcript_2077/g.1960 Transcript_2077/m.1960 type:complete len:109 (+) Transcript_2077:437-763(+)
MKRTDGFMSFKHSIRGGSSSNSLFPSSSGETIISNINSRNAKMETGSDITYQATTSTTDHATFQWNSGNSKQKEKGASSSEILADLSKGRKINHGSYKDGGMGKGPAY